MTTKQLEILSMIDKGKMDIARAQFDLLPETDKAIPRMMFADADMDYESGDDLSALRKYLAYLDVERDIDRRRYGAYGIAMCLKNLELHGEAISILECLKGNSNHPKAESEIAHSSERIELREEARRLFVTRVESCIRSM